MELTPEAVTTIVITARVEAFRFFAKRYWSGDFSVDDLIQAGCEAALVAYPRWDPQNGTLRTFLTPRIRGGIYDFLRAADPLTRRQRKAVKGGGPSPVSFVPWHERDEPTDGGYDHVEDALLIETVLQNFDGEAAPAVIEWVRRNGEWSQRDAAAAYGIHESAVSRGIKELFTHAAALAGVTHLAR